MKLNVSELSELTNTDRKVVSERLRFLKSEAGDKNAKVYHTAKALHAIHAGTNRYTNRQTLDCGALYQIRFGILSSAIAEILDKCSKNNAKSLEIKQIIESAKEEIFQVDEFEDELKYR